MFLKDKNGKLEFKAVYKDPNYVDISGMKKFKYIYNNIGPGDSGGPIMINRLIFNKENKNTKETTKENRNIIVAVTVKGYDITPPDDSICIMLGSKVSQDVVDWIKKMDSGDYSLGKIIHTESSIEIYHLYIVVF